MKSEFVHQKKYHRETSTRKWTKIENEKKIPVMVDYYRTGS